MVSALVPQIDMASPKHLLMGGLVASALVNVCIGATTSLPVMVVLWGGNGMIQSFGWPSITNVFLAWFPDPASRGAWYSLLSTCQNVGAALVPLLVSSSIARWGWKAALYSPAAASCAIAAALGLLLYGSPEAAQRSREGSDDSRPSQPRNSLSKMLGEQVVMNPALWLMAVNYFGVSMVRTCLSDWSNVFLREEKGLPLAAAARCLFLMELGGFAGSLVAGSVSDKLFQGRRGPVVCLCTLMLSPTLLALVGTESALVVQVRRPRRRRLPASLSLHRFPRSSPASPALRAFAFASHCPRPRIAAGPRDGAEARPLRPPRPPRLPSAPSVVQRARRDAGVLPLPRVLRVPGARATRPLLPRGPRKTPRAPHPAPHTPHPAPHTAVRTAPRVVRSRAQIPPTSLPTPSCWGRPR